MIFPAIDIEPVVQVGDMTRISAGRSFVSGGDSLDQVEIRPSSTDLWYDVTPDSGLASDAFLDWAFGTAGAQAASVRLNGGPATAVAPTLVVTPAQDYLYASDADLQAYEPDILQYVRPGRNSFLDVHRKVQHLIVAQLMRDGYRDDFQQPFTKSSILNVEGVHEWATFWALKLIEEGLSNAIGDVFDQKAKYYDSLASTWGKTTYLQLDLNGDGVQGEDEAIDTQSSLVVRR